MFTTNKARVIFYEKTGCSGNARQKESLIEKILEVKLCGSDIAKLNFLLHVKMPMPANINACLSSDTCNNA